MQNFTSKIYENTLPPAARDIRETVFVREQGFAEEFDTQDSASTHILLFAGETPCATCRLFAGDAPGEVHIGRVAVYKEMRKSGAGCAVMQAAEACAKQKGFTRAVLSAQVQARPFYEKCGYTAAGGVYPDQGCPHIDMFKDL